MRTETMIVNLLLVTYCIIVFGGPIFNKWLMEGHIRHSKWIISISIIGSVQLMDTTRKHQDDLDSTDFTNIIIFIQFNKSYNIFFNVLGQFF